MKRSMMLVEGSIYVVLGLLSIGAPNKAEGRFTLPKEQDVLSLKNSTRQGTQILAEFRKELGILKQATTRSEVVC